MSERPSVPERRVAQRQPIDVVVLIQKEVRSPGPPSLVWAQMLDISHQGAFILAPPIFRVGDRLHLEMDTAPELGQTLGLNIRCETEIVRVEPPSPPENRLGIGVRILSFDAPRPILFQGN